MCLHIWGQYIFAVISYILLLILIVFSFISQQEACSHSQGEITSNLHTPQDKEMKDPSPHRSTTKPATPGILLPPAFLLPDFHARRPGSSSPQVEEQLLWAASPESRPSHDRIAITTTDLRPHLYLSLISRTRPRSDRLRTPRQICLSFFPPCRG